MKKNRSMCFLCILVLIFILTFITNRIAFINKNTVIGSPLIGSASISFIGGILCLYVFLTSRSAFLLCKSARVMILSLTFFVFALFLIEIGITTFFRFADTSVYLQLFDIASLAVGIMFLLSYFSGKTTTKVVFNKFTIVLFAFWAVASLSVFIVEPSMPLHRYLMALGSVLFLATGVIYTRLYVKTRNTVVFYYLIGFVLIGNGLFSIAVLEKFGDILTWWGLLNTLAAYFMFVYPLTIQEN